MIGLSEKIFLPDVCFAMPRFTPEAMRANYRIVAALQAFGRTRGMTAAQVALAWRLQKEDWIVPIPGTTNFRIWKKTCARLTSSWSNPSGKNLKKQWLPFQS